MHLKILWMVVALTFVASGCHGSTIIPYGTRQQLTPSNYQTIYRSSEQTYQSQPPVQANASPPQTPGYLPPAQLVKPLQQQLLLQPQQIRPQQASPIRLQTTYGNVQLSVEEQIRQQYRPQPAPIGISASYETIPSASDQKQQQLIVQQSQSQPQHQPQQQLHQQAHQQPHQQPHQQTQQLQLQPQPQAQQQPQQLRQIQPVQKISLLSSYGPPASGSDPVHIGPPTAMPLPPLLPGSVLQQLQRASDQQQQQQQKFSNNAQPFSAAIPYSSGTGSMTITGQPTILIPANNLTLYAANLLATALLDEPNQKLAGAVVSGITNNSNNNMQQIMPAFIQIGPNTFQENNRLDNKTDLVIIKTQKTSYIIPMTVSVTAGGGPKFDKNKIHELYNQRDKLPIAYTVNQFLFFIKPENVNFLNKL